MKKISSAHVDFLSASKNDSNLVAAADIRWLCILTDVLRKLAIHWHFFSLFLPSSLDTNSGSLMEALSRQQRRIISDAENKIRIHTGYNYNNLKFSADVTVHRRCCFLFCCEKKTRSGRCTHSRSWRKVHCAAPLSPSPPFTSFFPP